ncbi:MAG: alkaline phosphatase [Bacteroidales bacterium]|nr:alkaline phosphatase [Bacteroidales bacterium]
MQIKFIPAVIAFIAFYGCSSSSNKTMIDTTETRDLSRYAKNEVPQENIYVSTHDYPIVNVEQPAGKKVKNVIFMIADGMGLAHTYSAWTVNKGKLNLDNFKYTALAKTYCANKLITDSGAAGTALATGNKTNYHSVGVDTLGNDLNSIADYAKENGLKTGVVVTCRLTDATPAAFCGNTVERDSVYELAADYLDSNVDYILGGGSNHFLKRPDKRNIVDELVSKGYYYASSKSEVLSNNSLPMIALLDTLDFPKALDRGEVMREYTMNAIERLNNEKGFFLMIEGSRIDDFGHFNEIGNLVEEIFDFDKCLGDVLKWAEKDGETLVVVTSDHETGGLSLVGGDLKKGEVQVWFTTTGHSGVMTPVYAYGPGADNFTGMIENTDVCKRIVSLINK